MFVILYVANSVSGPPSFAAVNIMFSMFVGRADLRLSPSRAKVDEEADFDSDIYSNSDSHENFFENMFFEPVWRGNFLK